MFIYSQSAGRWKKFCVAYTSERLPLRHWCMEAFPISPLAEEAFLWKNGLRKSNQKIIGLDVFVQTGGLLGPTALHRIPFAAFIWRLLPSTSPLQRKPLIAKTLQKSFARAFSLLAFWKNPLRPEVYIQFVDLLNY